MDIPTHIIDFPTCVIDLLTHIIDFPTNIIEFSTHIIDLIGTWDIGFMSFQAFWAILTIFWHFRHFWSSEWQDFPSEKIDGG